MLSAQPGPPSERTMLQATSPARGGLGRGARNLAYLLARSKPTLTSTRGNVFPSHTQSPSQKHENNSHG
jgi:hypothetical protein